MHNFIPTCRGLNNNTVVLGFTSRCAWTVRKIYRYFGAFCNKGFRFVPGAVRLFSLVGAAVGPVWKGGFTCKRNGDRDRITPLEHEFRMSGVLVRTNCGLDLLRSIPVAVNHFPAAKRIRYCRISTSFGTKNLPAARKCET